jgi:hypothetical protein
MAKRFNPPLRPTSAIEWAIPAVTMARKGKKKKDTSPMMMVFVAGLVFSLVRCFGISQSPVTSAV